MARNWNLELPQVEGKYARQAHVAVPEGSFEREIGRFGFSGPATHMYHRNPPTAWVDVSGPIRPRAFTLSGAAPQSGSPLDAQEVLVNRHVRVRFWRSNGTMDHLVRNGDGDDLLFFHSGSGHVFCDYGHVEVGAGDYLVVPRGTLWRFEETVPAEVLMVEATGSAYRLPDRGPLGRHAPFDPGVMDRPKIDDRFLAQKRDGEWNVRVKRCGEIGTVRYPFNPLDSVGWKGDLYPVRLNVQDIRAVSSHLLHLSPPVRTTFVADRFVICTITPRPVEEDPAAMKLPFFHSNDDYEEVIFYHRGKNAGRGNAIGVGTMTMHPFGIAHGPHPDALKQMFNHPAKLLESYSVMIDTIDPLAVPADLPANMEVEGYADSWRKSVEMAPDAKAETREKQRAGKA